MLVLLSVLCLSGVKVLGSTVRPAATAGRCQLAPPHAQPADANYRLSVAGDPDLFLPGELYTVSLVGVDSGQGPTPFTGFIIWAEVDDVSDPKESLNQSLGGFQAYDTQTKAHEACVPAVDNATAHPKTEVQVIWSAPVKASSLCVRLCARVSPVEGDSGAGGAGGVVLCRNLCAAPTATPRQPPVVEPCCACDEAKYEVTFEGMWSQNTHPRDFPPESARAHFGDVIGASHTAQYRVWQEGRVASIGLRRLADDGTTTALEKELKAESEHIRTIIKARGISWQQVAGGGIPSTFAVFRVDAKHHLVSLASKLAPSPDWIVGVSALELCNANCTWTTTITVPLFPYDAGTDSGIAYTSRRQPTVPASPVRALRPDWPKDVRSPFFSKNTEMRPFARLRLNRLRLYEKSCDTAEVGSDHVAEASGGACATHLWGAWEPCSVTCGPGRAARQRHYVWPARAYAEACRVPLTDYKRCYGSRRHCRAISEYEPDPAESAGPCAVSAWSEWSPCEGCGVRARRRHYLAPRAHKRCHTGFRARTVLDQALPCEAGPCHRPPGTENTTNFDWFFVDKPQSECPTTEWGSWSPCSAKCGRGRRLRTRLYVTQDALLQAAVTKRQLHMWNQRFAQLQGLAFSSENTTAEDSELETKVLEHFERCDATLSLQEALCDGEDNSCLNATVAKVICKLPMQVGHCRGYEERWFHESGRRVCEPFGYTGCGGNANNFRTKEDCRRVCSNVTEHSTLKPTVENATVTKKSQKEDNEVMLNDSTSALAEDADCETGPWLGWSECFGDCQYAVKLNYRLVKRPPAGTGKQCPKLLRSRPCKPAQCRSLFADDVLAEGYENDTSKNEFQ